METTLILIKEYCEQYEIEQHFVQSLQEEGLLEITVVSDERYIKEEQLNELEQFRRWHYDLNINIEGIDAMRHLINKVTKMQQEINHLKNQLRLHGGV
ncbi:chaperone modulator CbpM [Olivibacter domesticus]|uniref:MerR HTH family regulatory protein n=1 Tax=Olivibacter domesticus TaxID=407022 RepID=A0A1H7TL86_OLID1|nr:chaperone modulator CbpM [Olivibacter domesticus]SEL85259.1 MerR HTH family regulatory protein [Olivibacter domesticus]